VFVDVRVIAATNRDPTTAVAEGRFRQDLFYRLNVFPIRLSALRKRISDISLLVGYLIDRYAKKLGKKIRNIDKKTIETLPRIRLAGQHPRVTKCSRAGGDSV
jgi:formate hydrogenlyase transcriptional activator